MDMILIHSRTTRLNIMFNSNMERGRVDIMREIKFRAKDKVTGEWIYFGDMEVENNNLGLICYGDASAPDMETLGQFTGLHDKNGKEIYEGDIVIKHGTDFDSNTWGGEKRLVEQKDGSWYPVAHCYFDVRLIEVAGNVYENPELLNEEK